MDKMILCKNIGEFFGDYFEEDRKLCIDNGEEIFRYDTPEELLRDWVDTLVENHHDTADNPKSDYYVINDGWEKEIVFIYQDVIGKYPTGVRAVEGKSGAKWACSIDVTVPGETSAHGKNLCLGTYRSIVDAIFARREFVAFMKEGQTLSELTDKAKEYSHTAKTDAMHRKAPKCPICGAIVS